MVEVDTRVEPQAGHWLRIFGTIDCGLELMKDAWQTLAHVFSVESEHVLSKGSDTRIDLGPRFNLKILKKYPVDILVVEREVGT